MPAIELHFGVFLAAAAVLAITPGPGMTYVIARTVAGGRAEGIASSVGTGIGGLVHVIAAALGLSALLAESALVFSIVKYVGAAYLIFLGIRMLRSSVAPLVLQEVKRAGYRRALVEGIVTEALNVKTALFFLALIPQFVDPAMPALGQFLLLGGVCVALNTIVDVLVAFGASRLVGKVGPRSARVRALNAASGCTLIGLGAYVALVKADR